MENWKSWGIEGAAKPKDTPVFDVVNESWELLDPTPDVHALFVAFNRDFFENTLGCVEVKWSKRMTSCAGVCSFSPRGGSCVISLSEPLMKLRSRKNLVETLLHEMIHAYLFVYDGTRDRGAHGPLFVSHMNRINSMTGANITIYHSFHNEVAHFHTHWWRCEGPCKDRHPFYGYVKRSMNRAPGPSDYWHNSHQQSCGGKFVKIREPTKTDKPKKVTATATKPKGNTTEGASTSQGNTTGGSSTSTSKPNTSVTSPSTSGGNSSTGFTWGPFHFNRS